MSEQLPLAELLRDVEDADPDAAIFAAIDPASILLSPAVIAPIRDDGSLPEEAAGLTYLVEVSIAQEVLRVWRAWRDNRAPTPVERCEAVIYYAQNDAYLPA